MEVLLRNKADDSGRTFANDGLFDEAALWIVRTGSPRCNLPP